MINVLIEYAAMAAVVIFIGSVALSSLTHYEDIRRRHFLYAVVAGVVWPLTFLSMVAYVVVGGIREWRKLPW